jgi:hypothetical protein
VASRVVFSSIEVVSYNYNNDVKEDQAVRECSTNGEKINAYRIVVGKPEGKRQ